MVSQLIVKSEVALAWRGKALWIVQDTLLNYISASTGININQFMATRLSEVNLLSFSYDDTYQNPQGVLDLQTCQLYSGPISATSSASDALEPSFQDMIRSPLRPSLERLLSILMKRAPVNQVVAP
jgi:hypothetical protein